MPDFPDLFILRHGQTEWNAAGRLQGWQDSPLTDEGRAQAVRQGVLLEDIDLLDMDVFSSDSPRSVETARLALGSRATVMTDARLREIDVGGWTGKRRDDLRAANPELFGDDTSLTWYDHAPGGEGYLKLEARCHAFLADLHRPSIIFTHGITSRVLRCLALSMTPDRLDELPGGQGVVHIIRGGEQFRLG